mgnify:CR=1 FL=1
MYLVINRNELILHETFFIAAQKEAIKSKCLRRKCGAVLVRYGKVIGSGFNSPPGNLESQRRRSVSKDSLHEKVTDKTCCVHAERRALIDALKKGYDVSRTVMYFTSVDETGNRLISGEPYCTDCSKTVLDEKVKEWVLEHDR